ncbi:GntP family permease [Sediminibacillus albus]|uniref:Gluconate:H+ symporter, GntP family/Gnt-I system low-affinity gluconate transporter n=1 Tax=Sediminibacillus albus TaxID=407036 RepID=A0A1G8YHL5_9BACI|nr:gluconate:H+ symporter [Sediminibacillus albus]SDK02236.1 gluconate:H+ symporter, GntP family/Gnt-I system low-affinity gluconate transporter [Sediminibacillus albus]
MTSTPGLIIVAVLAVVLLLFLVMRTKLQAFIALLVVSLLVGLAVGMPPGEIITTIEEGMGGTLGFIAVIIGLGAMFGEMLRVSGGAERLALTLMDKFGEKNISWALGLTGFIVSIPVFLDVALVILVPILYSLTQKTKKSLLYFGIPLMAGLAVTHSFIPPTPGPISVASLLGADLGWVILFGALAGLPAMILAGPVFGKYIANKIHVGVPEYMLEQMKEVDYDRDLPSFKSVVLIILLPLILILVNTTADLVLAEESTLREVLTFIGHPFVALTMAALLTFYIFGIKRGYKKEEIQQITTKALEPAGIIILVTGAGGVFGEMLIQSGIGDILADAMKDANMPIIVFAFITATVVRIAQGSATVSMITAAGLVSPLLDSFNVSEPMLGLLVIAIASGATVVSHVNDSGFWLVNRYFGLTEKQTLKSWTVMETIIGLVGFGVALLLSLFV